MNRRDFLKRSATGATVIAIAAIPSVEAPAKSGFPETIEDMQAMVDAAKRSREFEYRTEGGWIPEGLSCTPTMSSNHWYYHKGSRIAVLHIRPSDNHVCFDIENVRDSNKVSYYPPNNNGKDI
jgi:hypothetical protein